MSMKYIISLSLICSVLSVAVNGSFDFSIINANSEVKEYSTNNLYEYNAEYIIGAILESVDITYQKIEAIATKTEDGSIVINEIEIIGCSNIEKAKIKLQEQGIDCDIKVK